MIASDRPSQRAGLVAFGAAAVLLAGVPGFLDPLFTTGDRPRAPALALLAAVTLLVAWARSPTRPALGAGRWLVLALPLLLAVWSLPARDGTWSAAARHGALWILLGLWPLALCWTWRGTGDGAQLLRGLAVAGGVAAVLALLEALRGTPVVGLFGRPGVAGPVFGALIAPAVLLPPTRRPVLRWLLPALLLAACLLTQSRTGVVAAVLGTGFGLGVGWAGPAARRGLWRATAGAAVLGFLLLALVLTGVVDAPSIRRTLDVRLGLHRASLASVAEAPVRGHGLGAYPVEALAHRDLAEARLDPRRRPFHAHLDLLHAAVEGGTPAGLLLLAFLGSLAALAVAGPAPRAPRGAAAGILAVIAVAGLGDGVLVAPAPVLLLGAAAAVLVQRPGVEPRRAGAPVQATVAAGAFVALLVAFVLARDALADRALMRYRNAIAGDLTPRQARAAARHHLEEGALVWRPGHPQALYRLGVHRATLGDAVGAREAWRAALRSDPALTEARLDIAQTWLMEDRPADARAALREAARRDPTRYEVARRMFGAVLGREPVPGDPPVPFDEIEALRWLNRARALAPDRFENELDEARFSRRRARDADDLARAGALIRAALAKAPGGPEDPPAEVLLAAFRLAEVEERASDLFVSSILLQAFRKNPRPATRIATEAERFLEVGEQRVAADDVAGADRAFAAAAIRLTALLYADRLDPARMLERARAERDAGRSRRALARYRALLAWTLPPQRGTQTLQDLEAPARLALLARQGDLLLEAAAVAHPLDPRLAAFYRTRGQVRIAIELLERGDAAMAALKLESAVAGDPHLAEGHYVLARARAVVGEEDAAERALLEALRLEPALAGAARAEEDLEALLERPAVRERLRSP